MCLKDLVILEIKAGHRQTYNIPHANPHLCKVCIFHISKEYKLCSSGEVCVRGQMSKQLLHFKLRMHLHSPQAFRPFCYLAVSFTQR